MWCDIRVQTHPFELGIEEQRMRTHLSDCGAIVAFVGLVREINAEQDHGKNSVQSLFLEHYPQVTESAIQHIVTQAQARWSITGTTVIHRVGYLLAHEPIVLVLVATAHRQAAFEAAQYIMDYLKTQAPFWKKEIFDNGVTHWVDAKASDAQAIKRWEQ